MTSEVGTPNSSIGTVGALVDLGAPRAALRASSTSASPRLTSAMPCLLGRPYLLILINIKDIPNVQTHLLSNMRIELIHAAIKVIPISTFTPALYTKSLPKT